MRNPVYVVIGGIASLVIAMGIGRFAYTPILPLMQFNQHFSDAAAGYLASSNYLGYLIGALLSGIVPWGHKKTLVFRASLVVNILSIGAMSTTTSIPVWAIYRFVSGLSSGMVFVFASSIVLDVLAAIKRTSWSGIFYSGVGIGIFLTGILVPFLDNYGNWRGTWLGLMLLSVLICCFAWFWTREYTRDEISVHQSSYVNSVVNKQFFGWLLVSYGFEGMGYIVIGTFLVDIASTIPSIRGFPSLSWIIAGIGAIPSTLLWARIGKRWGIRKSLVLAYFVQAIGVVIPVILFTPTGIYLAAFLFGGTFMGITTLATTLTRNLYAERSSQAIGYLTACYGIGQVLGPIGGGLLAQRTHSYALSLTMATIVLVLAALLLVIGLVSEAAKRKAITNYLR